jgi:hypothetical protein
MKTTKEFELPKKWCFKAEDIEEAEVFIKWLTTSDRGVATSYSEREVMISYFHYPNYLDFVGFLDGHHTAHEKEDYYKEITFQQFKEHVLKEKTMEKKIIGYILKELQFEKAANVILGCSTIFNLKSSTVGSPNDIKALREAGVLNLWFEPVYEEDEFKVGDWVSFYSPIQDKIITSKIKNVAPNTCYVLENEAVPCKNICKLATPEEIAKATQITLPFGKLNFTINKKMKYIHNEDYGKIPFIFINSFYNKLMCIIRETNFFGYTPDIPTIKFGCITGTFDELEAIYNEIGK